MDRHGRHDHQSLCLQGEIAGLLLAVQRLDEEHTSCLESVEDALAPEWLKEAIGVGTLGTLCDALREDVERVERFRARVTRSLGSGRDLARVLDSVIEADLCIALGGLREGAQVAMKRCQVILGQSLHLLSVLNEQIVLETTLATAEEVMESDSPAADTRAQEGPGV